jgi:hypothetical protein
VDSPVLTVCRNGATPVTTSCCDVESYRTLTAAVKSPS